MNKNRVTKTQRFSDIIAMLKGESVQYNTTLDDAVDFLLHEVELITKKSGTESKAEKAARERDDEYRALIRDYLATLPDDSKGVTCTEILRGVPALAEFSNQKISSLLRPLKESAVVVSETYKGKTLFRLA